MKEGGRGGCKEEGSGHGGIVEEGHGRIGRFIPRFVRSANRFYVHSPPRPLRFGTTAVRDEYTRPLPSCVSRRIRGQWSNDPRQATGICGQWSND